jgi:glycosyltransferase involved in cell wall biosynthesis
MQEPIVTIVMPSYNHEPFVESAIRSILAQTFPDFEIVVVDDGSADNTKTIIDKIKDPRLRSVFLEKNVGACEAINIGIRLSKGKFIAICNSDDIWEPEKLQMQVDFLGKNSEICATFSNVWWINDSGDDLKAENLPSFCNIFAQRNRSRFSWQRDLIERGNCLCHPSILIRKAAYDNLGYYNNHLRQLPDFDMWLRLVRKYEIHVMPDKLMRFRLHASNTSTQTPAAKIRTWAEHCLIARSFFKDIEAENFVNAFGVQNHLALDFDSTDQLVNEKISYLLDYNGPFQKIFKRVALEMAYDEVLLGRDGPIEALQFQKYITDLDSGFALEVQSNQVHSDPDASSRGLMAILRKLNRARLKRRRARRYHS